MDDINLLPSDFIAHRQRLDRLRIWLVVIGILVLVLPASMFAVSRQLAAAERQVTFLEQQRVGLKKQVEQLKLLHEKQQQLKTKAEIINNLNYRLPLLRIFFDVAALMDDEIWLLQLDLRMMSQPNPLRRPSRSEPSKPFFTSGRRAETSTDHMGNAEGGSVALLLQGYATSNYRLADFMSGLSGIQHFSKVGLQVARRGMFQGVEAIEFSIEMRL